MVQMDHVGKKRKFERKERGQGGTGEKGSMRAGVGGGGKGKDRGGNPTKKFRGRKVEETEEIEALDARILAGAPLPGSNPLASSLPKDAVAGTDGRVDNPLPYVGAKLFQQLPLSDRTKRGLKESKYTTMTAIQRASLPHSLCGRDVLGAAKTGSGKTLAFLLPVIEKLYRLRWSRDDGVGAIIISPTRELAYQIFDELKKVGKHHSLSAGLLIGGRKDVETEKDHVGSLNILVCTPGRLLQHMDETPNFQCSQLLVLVLDEADRILDLGFAGTLNAIVAELPKERQTLLFSATQTRSVQDLARLSLQDPEYLAVHAESTAATPARLQQTAMIVPLNEKMDMLWSFVKTHLHAKTLVFLSSCKQVKFVHEAFKRLRPGVPVKSLHGRMKQTQRMIVFSSFCETKHSVLFSTDVAARGLDFPSVDWVVQMDCPEDVASYIHRVGRTARYTAAGRSLLFLNPSEEAMLTELQAAKIPIKVIKANKSKLQSVAGTLASLLSKNADLKYLAQRAFVTYLRSIHLQSNKEVFDVTKLPFAEYAVSIGLPTTPRIRFLKVSRSSKGQGGKPRDSDESEGGESENEEVDNGNRLKEDLVEGVSSTKVDKRTSKLDRLFNRKNVDILSSARENVRLQSPKASGNEYGVEEEEFISKKRPRVDDVGEDDHQNVSSAMKSSGVKVLKKKKLKIDPGKAGSQRLVFDDEGNAIPPLAALAREKSGVDDNSPDLIAKISEAAEERFKRVKEEMKKRDKEDRLSEKQRLREKRFKNKLKTRAGESEVDDSSEEEDEVLGRKRESSKEESRDSDTSDHKGFSRASHDAPDQKTRPFEKMTLAQQEELALKLMASRAK